MNRRSLIFGGNLIGRQQISDARGGIMKLYEKLKRMLNSEKPKESSGLNDSSNGNGEFSKQSKVAQLTPREHDLYLLLLKGFTLKESAQQLSIKYSTANTHMTGIYRKLRVNSRAELIINYREYM
jgi:DNA-binding CsgD family transcriptional regulator